MTRTARLSDSGEVNILIVPLILMVILFVFAAAFGIWAFGGKQDYKNNSDQKVAAAVKVAQANEDIIKDNQKAEADKSPLKTYVGPEQYGSLHVNYPKTWSGYVIDSGNTGQPLDSYFQPDIIPNISDQNSHFALRVQIVSQTYASVVSQYSSAVKAKTVTASVYALPKVPSVVGVRYDGAILPNKATVSGSMIILPIRDKTLQVWTETPGGVADFNQYILPNLTFSP